MTFGSPNWLWILTALPFFLALFLWNEKRSAQMIRRVVATRLIPHLAGNVSFFRRRFKYCLLLVGFSLLVVAMAGPRFGYTYEEAKRKGHDVIIAIDTSRSMLANDLRPNRLTRAKMAAQDLIMNLKGDRVGLIAFAGNAFLQAPLTVDYNAVLNALQELDTEIIPRGGTNIAQAIETAVEAFGKGESDSRALVIFTDGEELDADSVALAQQFAEQLSIFTIGVGSEEGSIIPIQREGGGTDFVRDSADEIVRSKLDEKRLENIAHSGSGFYQRLENGPANMKRIITEGLGSLTEQQIDARMARRPIERYQWPLGAGLSILALSILINDRRRKQPTSNSAGLETITAVLLALLAGLHPSMGHADGVRMYHDKDFHGAYEYFQKVLKRRPDSAALHFDAGAAAYKLGRYDDALKAFSRALASKDVQLRESTEYNLGNTLFKRGAARESGKEKIEEWKGAVEHYDQALAMNSENENARYNRDLVKKLIDDLEKEQQQEKQERNQKNEDQQQEDQAKSSEQKQEGTKGKKDQDNEQEETQGDPKSDEKNRNGSKEELQNNSKEEGEKETQSGDSSKTKRKNDSKPGGSSSEHNDQDHTDDQETDHNRASQPQSSRLQEDQTKSHPSTSPADAPSPSDRDLSGEMQANSDQNEAESQEMPVAVPIEDGKMSPQQAAALLRSLRDEDAEVPLLQRQQNMPVLKDW